MDVPWWLLVVTTDAEGSKSVLAAAIETLDETVQQVVSVEELVKVVRVLILGEVPAVACTDLGSDSVV